MRNYWLVGALAALALPLAVACGGESSGGNSKDVPKVVITVDSSKLAPNPPAQATTGPKDEPQTPVVVDVLPSPIVTNPAPAVASPPALVPAPAGPPPTQSAGPDSSTSSPAQPPCCKPTVAPQPSPTPGGATNPSTPALPPGTQAVPAPIDGVDIVTLESFPPQYRVSIQAGLPSGCAKQYTNSVVRDGSTFRVTVLNSMPTGQVACTAIYGTYQVNLSLPGTFVSGQTYTVVVNDKTTTFKAQ